MKTRTYKKTIKEPEETLSIVQEPMGIYVTAIQNPINFRLMHLLDATIDTSKINNQETNIIQLIRSGISKKITRSFNPTNRLFNF